MKPNISCRHKFQLRRLKVEPDVRSPHSFPVGFNKIKNIFQLYGGREKSCDIMVYVRSCKGEGEETEKTIKEDTRKRGCKKDILVLWDNSKFFGLNPHVKILKKFIKNEKLGVEEQGTHLGFISFSNSTATELLKVGEIRNKTHLLKWLDSIHVYNDSNSYSNATRKSVCDLVNSVLNDTSPKNFRPDVDDVILLLLLRNGTHDILKDQKQLMNQCINVKKNVTIVHVSLTGGIVGKFNFSGFKLRVKRWPTPERMFEVKLETLEKVLNETIDASCTSFGKCECKYGRKYEFTAYTKPGANSGLVNWTTPEVTCFDYERGQVDPPYDESPANLQLGKHVITYPYSYKRDGKVVQFKCFVNLTVVPCSCPCPQTVTRVVRSQTEKVLISWLEPKPRCPTTPRAGNPNTTSGWFSVGNYTRNYNYSFMSNYQTFIIECRVTFVVTACECPSTLIVKKGSHGSLVFVSWAEPKPIDCSTKPYSTNPKKNNGRYAPGFYTVSYDYKYSSEHQRFDIQCHLKIIVTKPLMGFEVREIGSSCAFTCPLKNQNDTYKFHKLTFLPGEKFLKPGGNIQQYGNVLVITNLGWDDAGQYSCSIFDSNGNWLKDHAITILTIVPVKTYYFDILPAKQTSVIDDGMRFKFRCEYEKPSTELQWERRRSINGTRKTDYLPRSVITLGKDATQSVEEYIINKVKADDIGFYRCGVRENGNMRYTNVRFLLVKGKRPPVFHETKPVFVSKEENDISIQFSVNGAPSPDISCYLNKRLAIFCSGKTIEVTDLHLENGTYRAAIACSKDNYDITGYHKLIIRSALFPRDDGLYKCVARNDVGNASIQFRVNVTAAPKIGNPISQIYLKRKNEEGFVTCKIKRSKPRPVVTWYQQALLDIEEKPKENQWTISSNQPELVQSLQHRGMYKSTLRVSKNEGQSFYRCFAKNVYGNDSRIFKFLRHGD
ncbi:uncharacterized protein LOC114532012 [Dendronephthya gigantea]|uniref:uncharacterized protein LOC114532012 n=1 Tax=Dendronephthya gigantea TaxID=151771 RepID=UPI00106A9FBC|nr:uncharacterized protein LOC114532012 [Dendronephthya gigantea]XP_028409411.1 uncharacterized protein LOC114532012 [Dendronephthya gigantea]